MFEGKHKFRGIMRNKTADLQHLKGRKKAPSKRFSKAALRKTLDDDPVIKSSLLCESTKASQTEMSFIEEPSWMTTYKECTTLLREVDMLQQEIAKEKMKKMSSVCEKKHDKVIQQFVEEATMKLTKCEKKVKQMEHAANFNNEVTPAQKRTFTSMIIAMACNIRDESRKLRNQQQSQLHRQRQLTSHNKNILDMNTDSSYSQTQNWLSEQEFDMLQNDMMKSRNQQITKIVQSIYSLNALYKDLQTLVIEQGSLLDRVDQNIERTVHSVSEARKHLQSAKDKQQSGCIRKVRRFLVGAICLLLLIFFIKHV